MIDGRQVTIEERLPGTPLARDLPGARRRLDDEQLEALVEVLVVRMLRRPEVRDEIDL